MAQYTTPAQLDGLFKEVYADNIVNLIPDSAKLVKTIPFISADKENGNNYNQPVVLSNEHGMSFGSSSSGAFSLNNSIAMTMKNAQVQGGQMVLRSSISYDAASKASNSKKAFVRGTEYLVENMLESHTKFLEIGLLYGGSGLGNFDTISGSSATSRTITCTVASFASGIWSGAENAVLQFYDGSSLVSSGADSKFTITSVDLSNRQLTVSGTSTGITALATQLGSGNADAYWDGAYGNEINGLDSIITNTGTMFGIDAGTYSLWSGNSYSAGSAALTMAKVLKSISDAQARGLNEDVDCFINPVTWQALNSDQAALRSYDSSYKAAKAEAGTEAITFHSQSGLIKVHSHNIVKQGEGFIIPPKKVKRLGSTDITFKRPGRQGEDFFRELSDNAGYELRSYSDEAIFVECPARCVKITNITNS
tara:strand:+ start:217 stop:1485 length:1269 start_codon:yes stop_codon:yes gene_type:complete